MDENLFGYELSSCKEINSNPSSDSSEYSNNIIIDMKTDEQIPIGNIQHENHLIDYTNNHYINKIRNNYGLFFSITNDISSNIDIDFSRSNSPITIQNGGSMSGSNPGSYNGSEYDSDEYNDSGEDNDDIINNMIFLGTNPTKNKKRPSIDSTNASRIGFPKFKKLSYQEIEKSLDKYYDEDGEAAFEPDAIIIPITIKETPATAPSAKFVVCCANISFASSFRVSVRDGIYPYPNGFDTLVSNFPSGLFIAFQFFCKFMSLIFDDFGSNMARLDGASLLKFKFSPNPSNGAPIKRVEAVKS